MSVTFPPSQPTISGDYRTVSRFLKDPTAVSLLVNRIAAERWISDELLTGTANVEGGAVVITEDSPVKANDPFVEISPGAEYPLTMFNKGTQRTFSTSKFGSKAQITVESIKRQRQDPVLRALRGLANTAAEEMETAAMAVIQASVTATVANAGTAWSDNAANILRDVALIRSYNRTEARDYNFNALVMDNATYATFISHPQVVQAQTREGRDNVFYAGTIPVVSGFRIIETDQLAAPGVWAIDTDMLGGIARETLPGEGYTGSPVEVHTKFDSDTDSYFVQARHTSTAYVQAPLAGVRLTGAV